MPRRDRHRSHHLVLGAVTLCALLGVSTGPVASGAPVYSLHILGTLRPDNSGTSTAQGINAAGTVVGGASDMAGVTNVFRWSAATGMTNIGTLVSPYYSYGISINSSGTLCGYGTTQSNGFALGLRQASGGSLTSLPRIGGGGDAYAYEISEAGVSVGWSNASTGCGSPLCFGNPGRALVWSPEGSITLLPDLGGYCSAGTGVSSDGSRLCGYGANSAGAIRGFRIEGALVTELPPLAGYTESYAWGVNNAGQVVGYSAFGSTYRATLWNAATPVDLGVTGGANGSIAYKINNAGLIVGYLVLTGPSYRAAVFQPAAPPTDLNGSLSAPSTFTLNYCNGLNSAGQIVGDADSASVRRGFVLTPFDPSGVSPEPTVAQLELDEPTPNPSVGGLRVRFTLPEAGAARLLVLDVRGRAVAQLHAGWLAAGAHEIAWDGRDADGRRVPAGAFFVRLTQGDRSSVRKLLLSH